VVLDPAAQLGKILGNLSKRQQYTDENLTPEEVEGQLLLKQREIIELTGSATLTAKYYDLTSFVLDHPVLGELDSSILELDGGYQQTGSSFPLTFPISFAAGTSSSTLYTTTF